MVPSARMNRLRRKRKPDSVRLNLVTSRTHLGQGKLKISRVSVPLVSKSSQDGKTPNITKAGHDGGSAELDLDLPEEMDLSSLHNEHSTSTTLTCSKKRTHEDREVKSAESWARLRRGLLTSLIESCCHPVEAPCCICSAEVSQVYCQDCGGYMCVQCVQKLHTNVNVFHVPVMWEPKKEVYILYPLPMSILSMKDHQCATMYYRDIICVGGLGTQRRIKFQFCGCFNEAEVLIKLGFFAATPQRPQLAFQFQLFDLFEALLLECQVSVKDFTSALDCISRCPFQINEKKDVKCYKVMLNCFEEYRYLKNELRHMRVVCPEHSDGTQCPACPKSEGTLVLAIDGHFGLCRKKSAGKSVRPPLHDGVYFEPQEKVDDFVNSYTVGKATATKECNEFLAGNLLRSNTRYKALDETGVVGIVCRHEFPYRLYNLRHGERISYIVYALEMIKEQSNLHSQVLLLYDVACLLQRHLQGKGRTDLLNFFRLAVPVFHVYGHKVDCQMLMSPRNKDGFALSDGETCERLWSFMRRFSRMTKEMRPSHRIDVLTDALLHFARLSVISLGSLLPKRLAKAEKLAKDSQSKLSELFINSPVDFGEKEILEWLDCEQRLHHASEDSNQRTKVFEKLGVAARERWYMLILKAKFAEGHNMASRLSKAITAESKKMRTLLLEYNSIVPIDDQLSWEDVTELSSTIWRAPQQEDVLPVPRSVRLAAIDALMKKKRAIEEQDLIKAEMENVIRFHLQQHASLGHSISHLQSVPSVFNRGSVCLLKIKQYQYETAITGYIQSFPKSLNIPDITFLTQDDMVGISSSLPAPPSNNIETSDSEDDEDLIHTDDLDNSSDDSQFGDDSYQDLLPISQLNVPPVVTEPDKTPKEHCTVLKTTKQGGASSESTNGTSASLGNEKSQPKSHTVTSTPLPCSDGGSVAPTRFRSQMLQPEKESCNPTTMASAIPSQSDLDSDSGSDCEEFKRARDRIKYVKEKLEREEFLKGITIKELEDVVAEERKATAHKIIKGTPQVKHASVAKQSGAYLPPRRTMYLHRSTEDLERIVRLSRENIQRERVAERLLKEPYFKKTVDQ